MPSVHARQNDRCSSVKQWLKRDPTTLFNFRDLDISVMETGPFM